MNRKIKCIIVDDEHLARTLLSDYASKISELEIVKVCKNALEAMNVLQSTPIDLIFLDIQMPELTGIDFIKSLDHKPQIIFTTAYSEYALEAYELNVIAYLLKPIAFARFMKACNKAIQQIELIENNKNNLSSDKSHIQSIKKDYITVKADYKVYKINFSNLIYIESLREYVVFHTKENSIKALASLKSLEEELPKDLFIRIHKSYIISIDQITALNGNMIELNQKKIPIGKSYKEDVLKIF